MKKLAVLAVVFASTFGAISSASAADGCKALLCFANPNGPMAVAECVSTVREVIRDMAKGRPFPTCNSSDGSAVNGTIRLGYVPRITPIDSVLCHPSLLVGRTVYQGGVKSKACSAGYAIGVQLEGIEPFTYYTVPSVWNSDAETTTSVQYWRDKNGVAKTGQRF